MVYIEQCSLLAVEVSIEQFNALKLAVPFSQIPNNPKEIITDLTEQNASDVNALLKISEIEDGLVLFFYR